jgi:hypothetical protein
MSPRTPQFARIAAPDAPFESRRRRRSYTIGQKLEAISFLNQYGIVEAVNRTGIKAKRIYEWTKFEFDYKQLTTSGRQKYGRRLPGGGGQAKFVPIEQKLTAWVAQERKDGHIVSYTTLRTEAQRIAKELGFKDFRASWTWMHSFCERNGFSYRLPTHVAQQNTKPPNQKCFDMLVHLNSIKYHLRRIRHKLHLQYG